MISQLISREEGPLPALPMPQLLFCGNVVSIIFPEHSAKNYYIKVFHIIAENPEETTQGGKLVVLLQGWFPCIHA